MKRRKWDSKTKSKIVLEGLSGKPVSEICNEYGIYQNQYYNWWDQFLNEAHSVFEPKKGKGEQLTRLLKERKELKQIIGALTVELKKTEEELQ
jgi:transposase-like protein